MPTRKVTLKYPEQLIQEPVLFRMAMKFNVVPNIRRARIDETIGEMILTLEGTAESLEQGVRYLRDAGVLVDPVEGDIVE
jgi:ABC-type methionine transport system ATPase subunit